MLWFFLRFVKCSPEKDFVGVDWLRQPERKHHQSIGDVVLTNISRETKYFHVSCSIQDKRSSPFLGDGYTFLNFGHFSASFL